MLEYNYLVKVPSGFQPRINQYIFDNHSLDKVHVNVEAGQKYILIDRFDLDNMRKVYRKLALPFEFRKSAIQPTHVQK